MFLQNAVNFSTVYPLGYNLQEIVKTIDFGVKIILVSVRDKSKESQS